MRGPTKEETAIVSMPGRDGPTVEASRRIDVVLRAQDMSLTDARGIARIRSASFEVYGGEIVGIAAIEGAGHRELLRALAGRLRPTSGSLERPAALGFIPEDRQRDALMLDAPLLENMALRGSGSARGVIDWVEIDEVTGDLLARHEVMAPGPRTLARALSGGNQQKLVLARELSVAPRAVIAENPTRGLDIRATAAVHARLRAARDGGAAVVFYSSDLDEVLALANRVLAVSDGTVIEVRPTREEAGRAMLGLSAIAG